MSGLIPPTQRVVVLPDSSPTGILRAQVVIVTDVQPQDTAVLRSQFLGVLCHVIRVYTFFLSERGLQGP